EILWSDVLRETWRYDVVNLSLPGATAKSAWQQAERIPADAEALILLEIGGNDLLSGRPADEVRSDLHTLLERVVRSDRKILMMELPLPPWNVAYGRAQRELADEFGVGLITKRDFARVLSWPDATVD